MASEDGDIQSDPVSAETYASISALREAHVAEPAFLKDWREPDKAVFSQYVAEQEALFKDWTLAKLTEKVARQSKLTILHTVDKCCVVGGKLSIAAQLHGTLIALRKCQAAATIEEQANREKLIANSSNWYQSALVVQRKAAPAYAPARGTEPLPDATAPPAFLKDWREPDKALFRKYTAEQEELFNGMPLNELTDKVARQSKLTVLHTVDKCCVVDGKLSLAAQLHGTVLALRKCQAAAALVEQANPEKLNTTTFSWLQSALNAQSKAAPAYEPARAAEPLPAATAPLAFLESWSEPDKALFYRVVAEQEALFMHFPLSELNDKVARQSRLVAQHTDDKCFIRFDGNLSLPAQLRATLLALRKCIPVATLKAQADQEKPSEGGKIGKMFAQVPQVSDTAFRVRNVRNEATPAPAAKKQSADPSGPAQKKHKGGPGGAKEAPAAVSPQRGAGHSCSGCWKRFPASELNFSESLHFLVCEKCELILTSAAPPPLGAAAGDVPLPPAALAAPPGADGSSAAALASKMQPGSARRAAAAVLAEVAPGGLPVSDVLQRALALGLFTPQLTGAGGSADVAAWAEMSGALLSDDAFVALSPGVFALRSLLPRGTAGLKPPATVPAAPVATLSADELRARLAASLRLRSEAEALLRSPAFHRAAREARAAGDATALARHFATIHPERELARSPDVYLALANGNYEHVELELLWRQLDIAGNEMNKGQRALESERKRRIAAESRAIEAIERAVAAEAREAAVSRRAVAIVRRAGLDPYDLLFAHDAEAGEGGDHGDDDVAAVDPPSTGAQEPDAPPAGDGARAETPVPAAEDEGDACAAPPPLSPDADVTGDAPPEPPEEAMPEAAAPAAGFEKAESSLEAPHVSDDTAVDLPAAAVEEDVVQQAAPLPTSGDAEPMDDDRRKRDASELPAEEPVTKAARVDEPLRSPEASSGGDCAGAAAALEQRHEAEAAMPPAAPPSDPKGSDAAAVHVGEEEVDAPLAAPVSIPVGIDADCANAPAHAPPGDCSAFILIDAGSQPVVAAQDSGRDDAPSAEIVDSTAAAAPVAPDAADPATAASAGKQQQIAPQQSGQMCLCNAVLAEAVARGDVVVNCSTCARPFHPVCCGYPAGLSAAAAEAMRPPFSCYDHRVYFPPGQQLG